MFENCRAKMWLEEKVLGARATKLEPTPVKKPEEIKIFQAVVNKDGIILDDPSNFTITDATIAREDNGEKTRLLVIAPKVGFFSRPQFEAIREHFSKVLDDSLPKDKVGAPTKIETRSDEIDQLPIWEISFPNRGVTNQADSTSAFEGFQAWLTKRSHLPKPKKAEAEKNEKPKPEEPVEEAKAEPVKAKVTVTEIPLEETPEESPVTRVRVEPDPDPTYWWVGKTRGTPEYEEALAEYCSI